MSVTELFKNVEHVFLFLAIAEKFSRRETFAECRDEINCNRSKIAGACTRLDSCVADPYGKLGALIATIDRHCSPGTYVRKTGRMLDRAPYRVPHVL